jgi:hypothetical protein
MAFGGKREMKIKTTLLTAFSAATLAIGVIAVVVINQPAKVAPPPTVATVKGDQAQVVTFTAKRGQDVLTQLRQHAAVVTKDSAYGPYVDAINGVVGGTDGKYWSFYVDGKLAQKGAAEYVTTGGETIQWKFEKM